MADNCGHIQSHGASVNDNLRRDLAHITSSSVEDVANLTCHLGPNSLLTKPDIKKAYRLIPVQSEDGILKGILRQESAYIDCQLPFSLASAPAICRALSGALEGVQVRGPGSHLLNG